MRLILLPMYGVPPPLMFDFWNKLRTYLNGTCLQWDETVCLLLSQLQVWCDRTWIGGQWRQSPLVSELIFYHDMAVFISLRTPLSMSGKPGCRLLKVPPFLPLPLSKSVKNKIHARWTLSYPCYVMFVTTMHDFDFLKRKISLQKAPGRRLRFYSRLKTQSAIHLSSLQHKVFQQTSKYYAAQYYLITWLLE